jgi:uncharacterized surface protein with fasciclin (FAS1) repeats
MKNKKIITALFTCALFLFIAGCKKDNAPEPQANTIANVINTNANFSTIKTAVDKVGLGNLLASGKLTIFIPDNDAFAASGITAASLNTLPATDLTNLLKYHILNKKILSADLPASDTITTLHSKNIFISKNTNGLFVNGLKIKTSDIQTTNGVIHVIEKVLTAPIKTIKEQVAENTNLSLFAAALSKTGLSDSLHLRGKYTVFAPNNLAFQGAGLGTVAAIQAAPLVTIKNLIRYHIVATHVFSTDFINKATLLSLQGTNLITGTNPLSVKVSNSTAVASNLVVSGGINLIATNGVIHIIDRVLKP